MEVRRSYFDSSISAFRFLSPETVIGRIAHFHSQDISHAQTNAWREQVQVLQSQLLDSTIDGHIFFEFTVPRMGLRADVILLIDGIAFLLEFKVGSSSFLSADKRQTEGYALDLKHFHLGSHKLPIVPILVATHAPETSIAPICRPDGVFSLVCTNGRNIGKIIQRIRSLTTGQSIDPVQWRDSPYQPTPTIIQAAQALYADHAVEEIARSDAGAKNLTDTSQRIREIIAFSRSNKRKSICFVTGVPGSGKTLVGLNLATSSKESERAVFLSGNGPLVQVLREALARDEAQRNPELSKQQASRKVRSFIQNIHHFRDEALSTPSPPSEQIVVFDEAQRAWDRVHTSRFMIQKRGQANFDLSEPEFLLQYMDRHSDWCVVVGLMEGGKKYIQGKRVSWNGARRFVPDLVIGTCTSPTGSTIASTRVVMLILQLYRILDFIRILNFIFQFRCDPSGPKVSRQ